MILLKAYIEDVKEEDLDNMLDDIVCTVEKYNGTMFSTMKEEYEEAKEIKIDGYTLSEIKIAIKAYHDYGFDDTPMQSALEAAVKIADYYKSLSE